MLITHDMGVIAEVADRVVVMNQSKVVEQGPVDQIFHSAKEPYTQGLISAVPRLGSMAGKDDPEAFHPAGSLQ
jgi:glutathione transport system ATP-binding protein